MVMGKLDKLITLVPPEATSTFFAYGHGKHIFHLVQLSCQDFGPEGALIFERIQAFIQKPSRLASFIPAVHGADRLVGWVISCPALQEATIWSRPKRIEGIKITPMDFIRFLTEAGVIQPHWRIIAPPRVKLDGWTRVASIWVNPLMGTEEGKS